MYVCALDKAVSGAGSCLWPSAMVRLGPHWHAVKQAGIITFAIRTIAWAFVSSYIAYHGRCTLQGTI